MNDSNPTYHDSGPNVPAVRGELIEQLAQLLLSSFAALNGTKEALNQTTPLLQLCSNLRGSPDLKSLFSIDQDISGIGISISFLIQGIYFILFGPILAIVFVLLPKRQSKSGMFYRFLFDESLSIFCYYWLVTNAMSI